MAGNARPDGTTADIGVLAVSACSVIMKVFYIARVVRVDLARAITLLTQTLIKWSTDCDRRLEALMGWVKKSWCYVQIAWTEDPPSVT